MDTPTVDEIKALSNVDFASLSYSDPQITSLIAASASVLVSITGQTMAEMPPELEPLALQAIRGMTEQFAYQGSPEYLETLSDFDLIQSFSAGPYSETRRSAEDAMKARQLNAWPWLSDLLWAMLTDDKRDEWLAYFTGQNVPAFGVVEVEWGLSPWDDWPWGA